MIYDVLITYQHKARELEAILLVKRELEHRGYTVALYCTFVYKTYPYYPKVKARLVIASALYDDPTLAFFVYNLSGFVVKVINFHWEQILSVFDEKNPISTWNPKGNARKALHLCWGEKTKKRLVDSGVPIRNVQVNGFIPHDLKSARFNGYYMEKVQLALKYNLPADKKWILFISSFTLPNMTIDEFIEIEKALGHQAALFKEFSIKSKQVILSWLEQYARIHPTEIIIYRPHPDEIAGDKALAKLVETYSNFRLIGEISIRQWIYVSDFILNWYSTSVLDIHHLCKPSIILRPVAIPEDIELAVFTNAAFVVNYAGMERSIGLCSLVPLPVPAKDVEEYCAPANDERPNYILTCDIIECYLKDTSTFLPLSILGRLRILKSGIKNLLIFALTKLPRPVVALIPWLAKKLDMVRMTKQRLMRDFDKNYITLQEENEFYKKIHLNNN